MTIFSGSFFFSISQNEGNTSGASIEDRTKRFFASDSKMVGPVSHVSLFSDFDLCPENFFGHADTEITVFENSKIENQAEIF